MYTINKLEERMTRVLRMYPILAVVGLAMTTTVLSALWQPVLAYVFNAFARIQYVVAGIGVEETFEDMQVWDELIATLNSISNMGVVGKMFMALPSIFRMLVVVLTAAIFILMLFFLHNVWEASIDYRIWHKLVYQIVYICKGLYAIARTLVFVIAVAAVRTFYGMRKMCRKGRKAYRRWKREHELSAYETRYLEA